MPFKGVYTPVSAVTASAFDGVQIAFFSAGTDAAKEWSPIALEKGADVAAKTEDEYCVAGAGG